MKKIILPIFFKTEQSKTARIIEGDDYELGKNCSVRQMTFYNINCIAPFEEDGKMKYTSIFSNGEEFICNLTVIEVEKIIEKVND